MLIQKDFYFSVFQRPQVQKCLRLVLALEGAVHPVNLNILFVFSPQQRHSTGTRLPASPPPLQGDRLMGLVGFNAI